MISAVCLAPLLTLPGYAQQAASPATKPVHFSVDHDGAVKGAAQSPKGELKASGGNSWFDVTSRELGTFYGTGTAVGVFEFENPTDEEIEWRSLDASCQCASAEIRIGDRIYRVTAKPRRLVRVSKEEGQPERLENVRSIVIAPGEKGTVQTMLDMHNAVGPKRATLDIHTTDTNEPHSRLSFQAVGAQMFTLSPREAQLNVMTWNEVKEFEVTVRSPRQPDWDILRMDEVEAFDVTWEKQQANGETSFKIKGKYGPVGDGKAGGGMLRFYTNVNGASTFDVRVTAFVKGPLEVQPGGFLTLGLVRRGKTLTKEIVFEPNDDTDLAAESLTFEKVTLAGDFLKARSRKDGNKLVVELEIGAGVPKGLLKGELVVKLNHPLVEEKRIMFNGFVR